MLIRVRYKDNTYDMVRPELLDRLLELNALLAFKRSSGWVSGNDASVRKKESPQFAGQDRRQKHALSYSH